MTMVTIMVADIPEHARSLILYLPAVFLWGSRSTNPEICFRRKICTMPAGCWPNTSSGMET